jgi:hypothetical protein
MSGLRRANYGTEGINEDCTVAPSYRRTGASETFQATVTLQEENCLLQQSSLQLLNALFKYLYGWDSRFSRGCLRLKFPGMWLGADLSIVISVSEEPIAPIFRLEE